MTMNCPSCQARVTPDMTFCTKCGTRLPETVAGPEGATMPAPGIAGMGPAGPAPAAAYPYPVAVRPVIPSDPGPPRLAASAAALIGALATLGACWLPFARSSQTFGTRVTSTNYSLFDTLSRHPGGYSFFYLLEPLWAATLGIGAAIAFLAVTAASRRWLASGLIAGTGIETALLLLSLINSFQTSGTFKAHNGIAILVGVAGGAVMLVAGLFGAVSGVRGQRAVAATPVGAPAWQAGD